MKIVRRDSIYVSRGKGTQERTLLKSAGFKLNKEDGLWYSGDDDAAMALYEHTIKSARKRLDGIKLVQEQLTASKIEDSYAEDSDEDIPCPEGLDYLPFQKAGITYTKNRNFTLIADSPGLGKAQNLDAKILTPDGWVRMGDLSVGDKVIGSNGTPCNVTGVFPQGVKPSYRVTFRDGTSTECCEEHLWAVKNSNHIKRGYDWEVKPLKDLVNAGIRYNSGAAKWQIPLISPIQCPDKKLPIDPYILGVLIGDGWLSGRHVAFSNPNFDSDISVRVKNSLPEGFSVSKYERGECPLYNIKFDYVYNQNPIRQAIEDLGLRVKSPEKFIPESYMQGSFTQRMELLKGLMDTDGCCSNNRTTYSTVSHNLANDIASLIRSLGGVSIVHRTDREKEHKGIEYYTTVKTMFNPFFTARKKAKWSTPSIRNQPKKFIKAVEYAGDVEQQCISVDAEDNLYVTDDYIVTHNTVQAVGVSNLETEIKNALIIVPASLKINWEREWAKWDVKGLSIGIAGSKQERIPDTKPARYKAVHVWPDTDVVIINYEMVKNFPDQIKGKEWDYVICDESHMLNNSKTDRTRQVVGGGTGKKKIEPIRSKKWVWLSGTPILHKPVELWTMLSTFDEKGLGKNWLSYIRKYCDGQKTHFGWDVSGSAHEEELGNYLREHFMVRRLKEDVLKELPPKTRHPIILPAEGLKKVVKKEYEVFCDNLARLDAFNDDKEYSAEALKEMPEEEIKELIAQLIEDDALPDWHDNIHDLDEADTIHFEAMSTVREDTALAKLPMAQAYIDNLILAGEKVIVFCVHKSVARALKERYPNAALVVGGMSAKNKQAEVDRFNEDEECNPIIGNLHAMGVGWTLVVSSHVVVVELPWDPSQAEQAEDRAHRIGQLNAVTVHYLLVNGSIECLMIDALLAKQEVIEKILN